MPEATPHHNPAELGRLLVAHHLNSLDIHCTDVEHIADLLLYLSQTGLQMEPGCLHVLADAARLIGKNMRSDLDLLGGACKETRPA